MLYPEVFIADRIGQIINNRYMDSKTTIKYSWSRTFRTNLRLSVVYLRTIKFIWIKHVRIHQLILYYFAAF